MSNDPIAALLTDLHSSLDRLADDLSRDRPDLAVALRKEAAWIPQPDCAPPPPERMTAHSPSPCVALGPLLYRALDEGLLPHPRFDALMVRRVCAAGVLRRRSSG